MVKVARLKCGPYEDGSKGHTYMLFDPHILRLENGRFTLHGFERSYADSKRVEYAQSWICRPETGEPDEEIDYRR